MLLRQLRGNLISIAVAVVFASLSTWAANNCITTNDVNKVLLRAYSGAGISGWPLINDDAYSIDCFSGLTITYPHSDYPKGSDISYFNDASFWAAGIVDRDTIASVGVGTQDQGFRQNDPPLYRSIRDPNSPGYAKAVSEQDIVSTAEDTAREECLQLQITKTTYAWSYKYAEDFILCNVEVRNIGRLPIQDLYFGPHLFVAVGYNPPSQYANANGSIVGYIDSIPDSRCESVKNEVPLMWFADLDGNPINGSFADQIALDELGNWTRPCTSVGAFVVLGYPPGKLEQRAHLSFNWWNHYPGVGPTQKGHVIMGWPDTPGDYLTLMSNGEFDYDVIRAGSILQTDTLWNYPDWGQGISTYGSSIHSLLSVGPYDLDVGQSIHVAYALVFGELFHTTPDNRNNLPGNPDAYYANVDFNDLYVNINWARWIYDNPGYDTDGDGYAGDETICVTDSALTDSGWTATVADTFFTSGDGIPDWRPVSPPPAPDLRLEPLVDGIRARFNGYRSETEKDIFLGIADFEGYSIYLGRDDRDQSLSLIASYDNVDYDVYVYNTAAGSFEVQGIPLSLDSLRCRFGTTVDPCEDSTFDPLVYSIPTRPYVDPRHSDSLFNFRKNSYNVHDYPSQTPIHKVYPEAPDPRGVNPENLTPDYYTEDGHFKFFEYECEIHDLLPSVQYYVAVTAFDFGMPGTTIRPMESAKSVNVTGCFVYTDEGEQNGTNKRIYVYPNPYRASDDYRGQGYEGRTRQDSPVYRTRALNFANLPPKCTISIFTLDGDLVRRIDHDFSPNDPNHTHDHWDLITRNTEAPVSGLYYWVVQVPGGNTQIGKLVLIM